MQSLKVVALDVVLNIIAAPLIVIQRHAIPGLPIQPAVGAGHQQQAGSAAGRFEQVVTLEDKAVAIAGEDAFCQ